MSALIPRKAVRYIYICIYIHTPLRKLDYSSYAYTGVLIYASGPRKRADVFFSIWVVSGFGFTKNGPKADANARSSLSHKS